MTIPSIETQARWLVEATIPREDEFACLGIGRFKTPLNPHPVECVLFAGRRESRTWSGYTCPPTPTKRLQFYGHWDDLSTYSNQGDHALQEAIRRHSKNRLPYTRLSDALRPATRQEAP